MTDAKLGRWLMIVAGVVVVATLAVAMSTLGSPATQREQQLDERRVHDLERIVTAVDAYVDTHDVLPVTLDVVARQPGRSLPLTDPVDRTPYTYQVTGKRTFKLCATFATDTAKTTEYDGRWVEDAWLHGAGRHCFDRKPERKPGDGS